ncbi:MAG: hypothetical protein R3F49_07740 [Planctomycetota bacterium]
MQKSDVGVAPRVVLLAAPSKFAAAALRLSTAGARVVRAKDSLALWNELAGGRTLGIVLDLPDEVLSDARSNGSGALEELTSALPWSHGWPLVALTSSASGHAWVLARRHADDNTLFATEFEAGALVWMDRQRSRFPRLVGTSAAMHRVRSELVTAASSPESALVWGASGTGKLLVARVLAGLVGGAPLLVECSRWSGDAATRPISLVGSLRQQPVIVLARVNQVVADERASFAGWVDQLSALQEARRVRLISTLETDRGPATLESVLGLRTAHRIDGVRVQVPNLRGRAEDLPFIIQELGRRAGLKIPLDLPELAALERFRYDWPGNVAELRTELRRAMRALSEGGRVLDGALVVGRMVEHFVASRGARLWGRSLRFEGPIPERDFVRALALATYDAAGDVALAARLLKCHAATLRKLIAVRQGARSGSVPGWPASGRSDQSAALGADDRPTLAPDFLPKTRPES